MKYIAMTLVLLLASCGEPVRGGNITGKYTTIHYGLLGPTTEYYLQLKKNDRTGKVNVTKEAWEQATAGMAWPFEVK
jgi:hypothetical protein